jgi:hypothetical protein
MEKAIDRNRDCEETGYTVYDLSLSNAAQFRDARWPKLSAYYNDKYALGHELEAVSKIALAATLGGISAVTESREDYWEAIYAIGRVSNFLDRLLDTEPVATEYRDELRDATRHASTASTSS